MKILRKALIILLFSSSFLFADEVYQVQKGDTLYSISRKYQITVAELRTANNLNDNDVLKAGQKLVIPTADIGTAAALSSTNKSEASNSAKTETSVYVVQKGDTFYSLARNNGMTVPELLSLNGLDSNAVLKVGQKLKIRKAASTPEKATEISVKPVVEPKLTEKTPDTRTYGVTTTDSSTSWPVKNPKITYINGKVSGVQLACLSNETVVAVREGTVMYVGLYRGFGQVLFVQSKTGLIYAYTGLGSVSVKKGDYVTFGTSVGTAGVDSIKGTPQITFMVFQNGKAMDPAKAPRG
ncbi:MAG: M23 family metallopeptidase [Treponema sp.]|nr:M23 family metallopeptidase [Treponema sp.]